MEVAQIAACAIGLLITSITLKDVTDACRRIIDEPHTSAEALWCRLNIRSKRCFALIQFLFLGWGIDRLQIIANGYLPEMPVRFVVYGVIRTTASVLIAYVTWTSMVSYRRLRSGQ